MNIAKMQSPDRRSHSLLTRRLLRGLFLLFGGIASAVVLMYAAAVLDEKSRLDDRLRNIDGIFVGMLAYDDVHGKLPDSVICDANGTQIYSWRFGLLPWLESVRKIDLESPWHAPVNLEYASRLRSFYCRDRSPDLDLSYISVLIGDRTPFQEHGSRHVADIPCDTILIFECKSKCFHWAAPGDIDPESLMPAVREVGSSFLVVFADGEIRLLESAIPLSELMTFAAVDETRSLTRDDVLGPHTVRVFKSSFTSKYGSRCKRSN